MPPPRILILSAYYAPFQGGTETHARTVARAQQRAGGGVLIVTRRREREPSRLETIDGIAVHRVGPRGPRTGLRKLCLLPAALAAMIRLRREFDLIYCPGYQGIGIAAIVAGAVLRRPVVLRSGNLGVLSGNQWDAPLSRWHIPPRLWAVRWLKRRVQRLYLRADAMVCNCRDNESEALNCGMPSARVYYLPNAVDVDVFRPPRAGEAAAGRAAAGWPAQAVICLYVGRISVEKGILDLLAAWRHVRRPGELLVLVGPDMPGPLDAGPAARRYVAEHDLGDSVRFQGPSTETAPLLRAADIYVQPSHYESFSNALVEAMATGLPIVASRIGGMLDCVVDGSNGLLFTPGSASDLGTRLRALLDDRSRAAALGLAARRTIVADFNERAMMQRFVDLFTAMCGAGRPMPPPGRPAGGAAAPESRDASVRA
jgi:glycosyltransferase involved in cell wall biosynthesis